MLPFAHPIRLSMAAVRWLTPPPAVGQEPSLLKSVPYLCKGGMAARSDGATTEVARIPSQGRLHVSNNLTRGPRCAWRCSLARPSS